MPRSGQLGLPLLCAIAFAVFALGLWATNGNNLPGMLQTLTDRSSSCMLVTVHDGDTIRCGFERVRLADIEAPELPGSPDCAGYKASRSWCDHELAYQSREELKAFLDTGEVELVRSGEDKAGQTLAIVKVEGVSAGEHLMMKKLARPQK
jgi:endonuclease YncB( thermonuclease family)